MPGLVALATCAQLALLDPDDRPLLPALAARGIDAAPAVWDDPAVDWTRFDLTVVRSTWDYTSRRDAFLAWGAAVPRLANPEPVLRWNTDKRYLVDLERSGIAIVPTRFLEPGGSEPAGGTAPLPAGELVVKPAVSAGSRDTLRHRTPASALAHADALCRAGRVAMIQPYLPAVEDAGETAIVYIAGTASHAIAKGPMLGRERPLGEGGLFLEEKIAPRSATAAERAVADAVMDVVRRRFGDLLYARVDLLPGPGGSPLLLELELTEPSLFLLHAPGATERVARAIAARL